MGIVSALSDISNNLQNYIVAPLALFGVGGFIFDTQAESIAYLSADITDHYSEDNKSLQDHIAIRPKRITLKGYVGELVYNTQSQSQTTAQKLTEKLTEVSAFLPQLTAAATQLTSAIQPPVTFNNVLSATSDIYGLVKNTLGAFGTEKNQQNAYTYFKALMQTKTLIGVQTPWEFMTNMAIESIVAVQDEKSVYITDFSITLKEFRVAQTNVFSPTSTGGTNLSTSGTGTITMTDLPPPEQSAIAAAQTAPVTQLGNTPGAILPDNSLPAAQSTITGATSLKSNPAIAGIYGGS